jgi:hypothetical protein
MLFEPWIMRPMHNPGELSLVVVSIVGLARRFESPSQSPRTRQVDRACLPPWKPAPPAYCLTRCDGISPTTCSNATNVDGVVIDYTLMSDTFAVTWVVHSQVPKPAALWATWEQKTPHWRV